jgi:hypothetical protein
VTTVLLTTVLVLASMAMLGIGVILGRGKPLKGSCRSVGEGCDDCRCGEPPSTAPRTGGVHG